MKKRSFRIMTLIGIIIVMIIAAIGIHTFIDNKKVRMNEKQRVLSGRKHLKDLEQADLSVIEAKIEKHHTPEVVLEDKEIDFYKFYENTVFMGDSITEGLMEMELVNQYNVISNKGDTVVKGRENIDKVVSLQPKNVVLLYGMNDVIEFDGGGPGGPDKFKSHYIEFINDIKTKLPNTNIYIQAPLPVMDRAKETNGRLTNTNLDEFRKLAHEVSEETGVNYVNIDILVRDKDELYEADGVHLKYDFYLKWLSYLQQEITSNN
ncbi:GDSL-type esterase/lipase family protein [Clostridium sp.]|uniref:GDSL-type esterase/lipase family protein n=1 Tax=Clostridium sp. TaxID=1506 RepID=UPI00321630E0